MPKVFKMSDGSFIPHPPTRQMAVGLHRKFYISSTRCEHCSSSTRYTVTDKCVLCQRYRMELLRYYTQSHVDVRFVTPWPDHVPVGIPFDDELQAAIDAFDKGVATVGYDICQPHGHLMMVSKTRNGGCMACQTYPSPRDQAIALNAPVYAAASRCCGCNDFTLRETATANCTACGYVVGQRGGRVTPDSVMMQDNPDMVISRDDAREYGFKVFRTGEACRRGHTGWRYVSTGNCITCLREVHTTA